MNLIIPMAGRGTRLRPHTLITPKPLLPIAGKPIVERLAEDIAGIYDGTIGTIAFIVGDFGPAVEAQLIAIAERLGAKGVICHQQEPLGTAHAIWQAQEHLDGEVIIAFADTLFRADFTLDRSRDGVIWVKTVSNPESFGVVTLDSSGTINAMVEKPKDFVSDLAIIGIYYIRDGKALRNEIEYLLVNDIREKGEYQLTNALETLKNKGAKFLPGKVADWMDCGNKDAVLDTSAKVLGFDAASGVSLLAPSAKVTDSNIIAPCFIGEGVVLEGSTIGPFVSIGNNTKVVRSVISNTIIRENSTVTDASLRDSMIGVHATVEKHNGILDIGDYSRVKP